MWFEQHGHDYTNRPTPSTFMGLAERLQEMCARLGAATGRGLLELIRERFGIGWALFPIGLLGASLVAGGVLPLRVFQRWFHHDDLTR